MKIKTKFYASQLKLKGVPQPVMGRPSEGRKLKTFFITEYHTHIIDELAKLEQMTPSRWLEAAVEQAGLLHVKH
jgi:hypothetical protein